MNLFVFDLFQAKILIGAYLVLFAILPTFLGIYFLYQAITTFVLSTLSDKQYTRWFATVLGSFIAAVVLLGGVVDPDSVPADKSKRQIQRIIFYSPSTTPNDGTTLFKTKQFLPDVETVESLLSQPYEIFSYVGSPLDVLSDDSPNLADGGSAKWGASRILSTTTLPGSRIKESITLGEFKVGSVTDHTGHSTIGKDEDAAFNASLHQLNGMLEELNGRLSEFPVLSGMLAYMTNTFSSLMYVSVVIAVSKGVNNLDNFITLTYGSEKSLWEDGIRSALNYKFNETYAINGGGPPPSEAPILILGPAAHRSPPTHLFYRKPLLHANGVIRSGTGTNRKYIVNEDYVNALSNASEYLSVCVTSSSNAGAGNNTHFLNRCNMSGGEYSLSKDILDKLITSTVDDFANNMLSGKIEMKDVLKNLMTTTTDTLNKLNYAENTCTNATTWEELKGTVADGAIGKPSNSACDEKRLLTIQQISDFQSAFSQEETTYMTAFNELQASNVIGYVSQLDESFANSDFEVENLANLQTVNAPAFTDLGQALVQVIGALGRLGGEKNISVTSAPASTSIIGEMFGLGNNQGKMWPVLGKISTGFKNVQDIIGKIITAGGTLDIPGLKAAIGGIGTVTAGVTLLEILIKLMVISAIAMSYITAYYGIIISTALGFALFPIWIAFALGKIIFHGAVGDTRGGITVFPMVEFIGFPLLIGAELCMLGVIQGSAVQFVGAGQNNAIAAVLSTLQGLHGTAGNVADSALSLSSFLEASACLGILIGISIVPMEIAKLLRREMYGTESAASKQKMQEAMQSSAVGDSQIQQTSYAVTSIAKIGQSMVAGKAAKTPAAQTTNAKTPAAQTTNAETPAAQAGKR